MLNFGSFRFVLTVCGIFCPSHVTATSIGVPFSVAVITLSKACSRSFLLQILSDLNTTDLNDSYSNQVKMYPLWPRFKYLNEDYLESVSRTFHPSHRVVLPRTLFQCRFQHGLPRDYYSRTRSPCYYSDTRLLGSTSSHYSHRLLV